MVKVGSCGVKVRSCCDIVQFSKQGTHWLCRASVLLLVPMSSTAFSHCFGWSRGRETSREQEMREVVNLLEADSFQPWVLAHGCALCLPGVSIIGGPPIGMVRMSRMQTAQWAYTLVSPDISATHLPSGIAELKFKYPFLVLAWFVPAGMLVIWFYTETRQWIKRNSPTSPLKGSKPGPSGLRVGVFDSHWLFSFSKGSLVINYHPPGQFCSHAYVLQNIKNAGHSERRRNSLYRLFTAHLSLENGWE